MSRSPQTLAPVQTHPSSWTRVIALFARLWHIIWWFWGTVIVGGFLIGVVFVSLVTKGTSGLTDPSTWVVIQPLLTHPLLTIIALIIAGILTLSAFLAHRHQKRITRQQEQAHEKSLVVVAEGVRKLLEDQTSRPVASPPPSSHAVPPLQEIPPTTTWNVPFRRNPLFTGREQVLKRLHDQLPTGKAAALTQPQAISGLGGIGKTQTAIEYAYRYRDEYQYVFWVRSDKREELVADFATLASLLNLPQKNAQDQNVIVEAVKRWLETHTNWLLILDNADDLEMASKFLPPASKGHILLTTRAQAIGNLAQSVEIEKMEPDEGALFLLQRAGIIAQDAPLASASTTDQTKARQIVQALDGLPLALDQAGAYIEETRCGLSSYLDIYGKQKQHTELLRRRGGVNPDHPLPVTSTWSLSFHKVEQANPAAADLLRLCAFLSPDAIPEEIITQGAPDLGPNLKPVAADALKLNDALGELLRYSLLRRNPDQTLSIHRLVQAVLKDEMNEKTQRQWAERTVRAVNHVFPEVDYETWPQCKRYIPHAEVCALLINQWAMEFLEAARLLNQAGRYLKERGQYTEAEPFSQRALAIRERVRGLEHDEVVNSLNNLASLYQAQGRFVEAEPLYQKALAICEKSMEPDDPEVARTLNNLAELYRDQGKDAEAEPLYQRALEVYEQELGAEHPYVATCLNNLANLYRDQGKYAEAEPLHQRALTISEQVLGREHPTVAIRLNNLALLYHDQGKYAEAEPLYQRALAIGEKTLGHEHPDVAVWFNNLANLYRDQGKYLEAEPLYQRGIAIDEKALGSSHPGLATALENYADLLRKTRRKDEAEKLEARAREIRDRHERENQMKRE